MNTQEIKDYSKLTVDENLDLILQDLNTKIEGVDKQYGLYIDGLKDARQIVLDYLSKGSYFYPTLQK